MIQIRRVMCVVLLGVALPAAAKDQPAQVVIWPASGAPVVQLTFGKFREIGAIGNARTYAIDTIAENRWGKKLTVLSFDLYIFDKNKARIGQGHIQLTDVPSGGTVKFQTTVTTSGAPASLEIIPATVPVELRAAAPPRQVSMTVNSVPQGALLLVDGTVLGTTPKIVEVGVGKHDLEFRKEGFNSGHFPLEIAANDASGGSVSYELGASAHDTLEFRDGTLLSGDLESVGSTEVHIRIGGTPQVFERNRIKRILLVERDAASAPQ